MTLTFAVEIALEVLLAATLCYCIVLERRLAAVRKGQEGLARTVGELNMAIAGAGASLRALKAATGEAARDLDDRLRRARLHIDELSLLAASGERIAQRIEGAAMPRGGMEGAAMPRARVEDPLGDWTQSARLGGDAMPLPSASIMNRLDSLRVSQ